MSGPLCPIFIPTTKCAITPNMERRVLLQYEGPEPAEPTQMSDKQ